MTKSIIIDAELATKIYKDLPDSRYTSRLSKGVGIYNTVIHSGLNMPFSAKLYSIYRFWCFMYRF